MSSPLTLINTYLPTEYRLSLEINPDKPNYHGELTFPVEKQRDSEHFTIKLHCHKLVIFDAYLGTEKLTIKYDKVNQIVELSNESITEANGDVRIKFMGSIQFIDKVQQCKGIFKTIYNDKVVVSTQCQPIFTRMIFPLIDECYHKIPLILTIKTKSEFEVVGNSTVESIETEGDYKIHKFNPTPPILPSVIGFTLGDLQYEEYQSRVPLRVYGIKGDPDFQNSKYILNILNKLFNLIEDKFGDYPLAKLDIVGIPYLTEGAMENWGVITIMKDHLFKGHDLHLKQLLSHELIHQWLGNLVSFDDWKYLWLNEAFATLLGNYFVSILNNEYELFQLELMTINERCYKEINIQKFMNKLAINNEITTTYLFDHSVYEKGIIILRMLINLVIDKCDDFDIFFHILKSLFQVYKYKSIKSHDIWKFIDEYINKTEGFNDVDVLSFINIWIRYDKYPSLQISENNGEVIIEQIQSKPYHFPLVFKTIEGYKKFIIVDKKTQISMKDLLVINKDKISLIKSDIAKSIIKNIDIEKLNKLDSNVYLTDYKKGEFHNKLELHVNSL